MILFYDNEDEMQVFISPWPENCLREAALLKEKRAHIRGRLQKDRTATQQPPRTYGLPKIHKANIYTVKAYCVVR